jgi:hypothetical protein
VVYGSPYEDKKVEFIDELYKTMCSWLGPVFLGEILTFVDLLQTKVMEESTKRWLIASMIE